MSKNKRILLVEDYEEKAKDIRNFLKAKFPDSKVYHCTSYNSAQEMIFEAEQEYDLILLDMSMSTFDLNDDASGGLPEPAAGQNILEGMYLRNISTPVIVVTMYNVFGRKELATFDLELKEQYPDNYRSYVYYSAQKGDWRNRLEQQIKSIFS